MNKVLIAVLLVVLFSFRLSAQGNYIKHTVGKGETITQIATKYRVTPYDIYQLNPDSQNGIKENDVVLVPTSLKNEKQPSSSHSKSNAKPLRNHTAKPKETLYSIAREYNVSVEDLQQLNSELLANGLKVGQTIEIPNTPAGNPAPVKATAGTTETKPAAVKPASEMITANAAYHVVAPKETKYGIAKKYGMTVAELEQKNPEIVSNLPIGFKLLVSGAAVSAEKPKTNDEAERTIAKPKPVVKEVDKNEPEDESAKQPESTEIIKTYKKSGYANYEVKPKETLYSLTQSFDITQEELIALNPSLKDGVKVGMILKVPGKGSIKLIPASSAKFADLSKSISKTKKELVLLLPFNASKIQGDTLKTTSMRLKKDAFLNMTLDFYSGALIAIDSARTLGLNVDVKIFDSQESKASSNVVDVVTTNKLKDSDAIIGPFYQQYVEKVAEMVGDNNVAVISPLSKEIGKSFPNLFQSMPSQEYAKNAMFDFMMGKGGNIIVVSDPKRLANKEFIAKKCPSAQFVGLDEKGALDVANLKSLLVKDKNNYVVLDSERTGMILGTTNALLNEVANYQIQLAIIEPNETLDFEEISMKRLTILKMIYPSFTRENDTPEALIFQQKYKTANKIFPSQFATRGFDITFDTLLRLAQDKKFAVSAVEDKTERVESKFEYARKDSEGYMNKGVYILEYQDDLSVKQVN
ncbi:MAG TPA: LysM peptidoglycan-binding domain-containing protein [Flavobacterium sp.]|jgi:LysM repeat protein|nr:LysM peptidoglycan-binding domain-containing protein [Flavobacterium sp.]HPJ11467.1 LysM peptidoglycan-binding domain-containing protein [Flavobacterium sp.]